MISLLMELCPRLDGRFDDPTMPCQADKGNPISRACWLQSLDDFFQPLNPALPARLQGNY